MGLGTSLQELLCPLPASRRGHSPKASLRLIPALSPHPTVLRSLAAIPMASRVWSSARTPEKGGLGPDWYLNRKKQTGLADWGPGVWRKSVQD